MTQPNSQNMKMLNYIRRLWHEDIKRATKFSCQQVRLNERLKCIPVWLGV